MNTVGTRICVSCEPLAHHSEDTCSIENKLIMVLPQGEEWSNQMQSRSGVAVDPSCAEAFQQLKLSKNTKFIIFKLNDEKTAIVVSKQSNDGDYETFLSVTLPSPYIP